MNKSTKKITTVAMMCAMAMVVNMLIYFPIIPSASFLSYDPKDIVIIIAGFIYGPMTSFVMSAICSILEITYRGGTIIDIIMNVISTCMFACTAAWIYKRSHTKKGAIIGLVSGIIATTLSMVVWNYAVTPMYYGMPRDVVVGLMLPGIIPFNLIKSGLNAGVSLFLYKPIVNALRSSNLVDASKTSEVKTSGMMIIGLFIVASLIVVVLGFQEII